MAEGKRAGTMGEVVAGGALPGSLLHEAMKDNPNLGREQGRRRARTPEQQTLLDELLTLPEDAFGQRRREDRRTVRLGEALEERLTAFFEANPSLKHARFFEMAVLRLLLDLGG